MNSSKQLSKYKTKDVDSRMLQPYKMWTEDQKRLLNDRTLASPRTGPVDRYLEPQARLEHPYGSYSQYRKAKNESTMRYNDNYLEVECGEGSMQYYRSDPNGTVSIINVRISNFIDPLLPIENAPYDTAYMSDIKYAALLVQNK